MNDSPLVSVVCLAYNHENYISKTLESIVCQKTSFDYEIIVHDDASTDQTAKIIEQFQSKYPDKIRPIYQHENQYSQGKRILLDLVFPHVKGRYVAFCECDDYWCDCNRLSEQVALMEENDCVACVSKVSVVDEKNRKIGGGFPRYKDLERGRIQGEDFVSLILDTRSLALLQFQISGFIVLRKVIDDYIKENPRFARLMDVGDIPLFLYTGTKGAVFYNDVVQSCYRTNVKGSWNNRNNDVESKKTHYKKEIRGLKSFDDYSNGLYKKDVKTAVSRRTFAMLRVEHDLPRMKSPQMRNNYRFLSVCDKIQEHVLYRWPNTRVFDALICAKRWVKRLLS